MKNRTLNVETLESREMCDVKSIFNAGNLTIIGDNKNNNVEVSQIANTNNVAVFVGSNPAGTFNGVKTVTVVGSNGNDDITINTLDNPNFLIPSYVDGGNGNDIIQGGGGSDILIGGNGDDIVTNFITDANYNPIGKGSKDILIGGNGNDALWGGWGVSDTINGGNGDDSIYDIVGGSNTVVGSNGNDKIIARTGVGLPTDPLNNPGGLVADNVVVNKSDTNVVLFDAGTQANGPVIINNTLYVLNLGTGSVQLDKVGNNYILNYNGTTYTYGLNAFNTIAGIGGNGTDTFTNNTNIKSVFYGQGGDDILTGGSNSDVLKGGNGNDYINGRGGDDDITGDAGSDTLIGGNGNDIIRYDVLDSIFADFGDRLVLKRKSI